MAERRERSPIRHRAGSIAELAALVPSNALDILVAAWRSNPNRCPTCGCLRSPAPGGTGLSLKEQQR